MLNLLKLIKKEDKFVFKLIDSIFLKSLKLAKRSEQSNFR